MSNDYERKAIDWIKNLIQENPTLFDINWGDIKIYALCRMLKKYVEACGGKAQPLPFEDGPTQ